MKTSLPLLNVIHYSKLNIRANFVRDYGSLNSCWFRSEQFFTENREVLKNKLDLLQSVRVLISSLFGYIINNSLDPLQSGPVLDRPPNGGSLFSVFFFSPKETDNGL